MRHAAPTQHLLLTWYPSARMQPGSNPRTVAIPPSFCTLGVEHVFVEPEKKAIACTDVGCNAVISVYDQPTLLQSILKG